MNNKMKSLIVNFSFLDLGVSLVIWYGVRFVSDWTVFSEFNDRNLDLSDKLLQHGSRQIS